MKKRSKPLRPIISNMLIVPTMSREKLFATDLPIGLMVALLGLALWFN